MPNFFEKATGLFSPHTIGDFFSKNFGHDNSAIFGSHHSLTGTDYATMAALAALGGWAAAGAGAGAGAGVGTAPGWVSAEGGAGYAGGLGVGAEELGGSSAASAPLWSHLRPSGQSSQRQPQPYSLNDPYSYSDPQYDENVKLLANAMLRTRTPV